MNAPGGPDRASRDQSFSPLAAEQARAAAGTAGGAGALTFPDLPRLELDQLLGQLVERAQEVMGTQGRLRGLLRANQLIAGDLALPTVLRRIAEAARELVGARYAALGVIGAERRSGRVRARRHARRGAVGIGHLPQGKGLLGALIDDPAPIRLRPWPTTPARRGSRPGTRRCESSSASRSGSATRCSATSTSPRAPAGGSAPRTSELAQALAATAAAAIDNARLYEVARSRQQWWQATAAITRRMLTGEHRRRSGDPLEFIAARTRELADADLVTVVLPADPEHGADDRSACRGSPSASAART